LGERLLCKQNVASSILVISTSLNVIKSFAPLAHLVEQLICNQ
jgi:hypothetical protein